ncbi:uncharacterized protein LOC134697046 [Mytilus trossulus]|uniref:uncharacterized protein LOC134697046 n=1 Tax=Mytilus trossulus TaxID=6551 RepID=UPI003007B5DA
MAIVFSVWNCVAIFFLYSKFLQSTVEAGGDAQKCSTSRIPSCTSKYTSATAVADDKNTVCNAGNSFLDCVNKALTDCNVDPSSLSETLAPVKQVLSEAGCGGGGDGQKCSTSRIPSCTSKYTSATAVADDKNTVCNAGNSFLDCVNKALTDCNVDPSSLSETLAPVKQVLSEAGCGGANGSGSLIFNLIAVVSGLTFYKLF